MLGSIKYNLGHLLDFKGRDARQTFWYYVLFLYVLNIVVTLIAVVPPMIRGFSSMAAVVSQHPAAFGRDPELARRATMDVMAGVFPVMAMVGVVGGMVMMALLAASLVRRLHDFDLAGWWALLPVALYTYGLSRIPEQLAAMNTAFSASASGTPPAPMQMYQAQLGPNVIIGWLPFILVIIAGVRKSTAGPNRYGSEPVSF